MIISRKTIDLHSTGMRPTFHNITEQVKEAVANAKVREGICVVYSHHTTCSVILQECSFDETYTGLEFLQQDLLDVFETLIPTCRKEGQYMHPGPQITAIAESHGETKPLCLNTDGHLRSVLIGRSESIVIADGELDLGSFGQVYFVDFDQTRARDRQVQLQILGE